MLNSDYRRTLLGADPRTWSPPKTPEEQRERDEAIRRYDMKPRLVDPPNTRALAERYGLLAKRYGQTT